MHLSYVPGNSVLVTLVLVVMIDPKVVAARVNTLLSFKLGPGRQPMDGPVFMAMVEALVESLNEQLGALMNPVLTMHAPNVDSKTWNEMVDKLNKSTARAVLMTHDEVQYAPAFTDYITEAGWDKSKYDEWKKAASSEPDHMKAWPSPKGPMTTSVAYQCKGHSCPPRAPISAQLTPTCYTCGKPMERV